MIVTFNEESPYGQDVLMLAALVADLMDNEWNKEEIKQHLKRIRNTADAIREDVARPYNNVSYFGMEVVE